MVFRLGHTPFQSGKNHRVTAHHHDGVVAVTLSHGVSRCLGVSAGSRLRIAYSGKPGELLLTRASSLTQATVDLYQNGSQIAFNLNAMFLPCCVIDSPNGPLPVRNYWRDTETLALDFSAPPISSPPTEQRHDQDCHA